MRFDFTDREMIADLQSLGGGAYQISTDLPVQDLQDLEGALFKMVRYSQREWDYLKEQGMKRELELKGRTQSMLHVEDLKMDPPTVLQGLAKLVIAIKGIIVPHSTNAWCLDIARRYQNRYNGGDLTQIEPNMKSTCDAHEKALQVVRDNRNNIYQNVVERISASQKEIGARLASKTIAREDPWKPIERLMRPYIVP